MRREDEGEDEEEEEDEEKSRDEARGCGGLRESRPVTIRDKHIHKIKAKQPVFRIDPRRRKRWRRMENLGRLRVYSVYLVLVLGTTAEWMRRYLSSALTSTYSTNCPVTP